ncbi:MAG: ribosome silencing factor [Chthoniobacterales bacterium]
MTESIDLAKFCAAAADDIKAEDIQILDLGGISSFTDAFVICTANSDPQLRAIASNVRKRVKEKYNRLPLNEDGAPTSHWVVLDYGDVLVHVFQAFERSHYDLENLWKDAPQVEFSPLS